ncbi:uncharacterized protein LOC143217692 [Lasioglossum baleicum]|uniref:uncharacterized protein LOC143217692 n=1 Tax=Lasioglossum baleicum TaxID=434251 RepID=UPI003FCC6A32
MDSIKSQMEVLSEDSQGEVNYISWRFKLNLALRSKGLYSVATGLEMKPEGAATDVTVKAWIKKDLEAQTLAGLNVSSNIARKIANCKTAHQMLDKLEVIYGRKSDLTIEGLQRRFFSYKYDTTISTVENCLTIQQYAEELTAEGEEVRDTWTMTRILGILPPRLHHFRTAWDNVSGADKTLDKLIERLRLEEDRLSDNDKDKKPESSNALISNTNGTSWKSNSQKNSSVECFKCGMKGHVKKHCKNKPCAKYIAYCKNHYACNVCNQKGHFARECQKSPNVRNTGEKNKSDRRAFITVGLTTAELNSKSSRDDCSTEWYQDCAATQHMTSRADWITNPVKLEQPIMVMIGDGAELEGVAIGDIQLEAFNGQEWCKIVLKNVLHVPKLTFNLFSVTQMLDKGYVQTANADQSIFKTLDTKETVGIAKRDGKLYQMMFRQEELSKCLVNASIRIWHEKLAHQNIRYVRDILKRHGIKYTGNPEQRVLHNRQTLKTPARFLDYLWSRPCGENHADVAMVGEVEDISTSEALKDKNWREAMSDEFESLTAMKTWELVEPPCHTKPLTCRWVLRRKHDGRFKARLVVRGFQQEEGINYFETFSPVARYASIRLILSLAASAKMKLITFDVRTAFLYGDLEEEIFMHQPEAFKDGTNRVCRLRKSLYGLKQAPKNWNAKFSKSLQALEFSNTDDDPCIYYNKDRSTVIALFVDDGLVAGTNKENILQTLDRLNKKFKIIFDRNFPNDMSYLGMQIKNGPRGIFVSQPQYTKKIVERFKFDASNPSSTPMERGMVTDEENYINDRPLEKAEPYREAIGSLLYLATISRPDITFAVNYLSRFNCAPMVSHWRMIKRIFQYLKGTIHFGIYFDGGKTLVPYTDSDYGGDTRTGHSTSGGLIMRGGPIVWYTQRQRLVATSTAEAEYRAAVSSIDEICWIRRLGAELRILELHRPTLLHIDNQSAIHMLHNTHEGKITKGKKHIDIARKFVQEHIGKTVELRHVRSSDQLADILTKPLARKMFEDLRRKLIKEEC